MLNKECKKVSAAVVPSTWMKQVIAIFLEPQKLFAETLGGSKCGQVLALVALPLWLTPAHYDRYFRIGKAASARTALSAASSLWAGAMTVMGLPIVPHLQAELTIAGKKLGYWDDPFSAPVVAAALTMAAFVAFMAFAAIEWVQTWIACLVDNAIGAKSVSAPPFGFFATKVAGDVAGLALCASAFAFAIRPVNEPIWRWLADTRGPQALVVLAFIAVFWVLSQLKARAVHACGRQIYGSWAKSVAYRLGTAAITLGWLWLLTSLRA